MFIHINTVRPLKKRQCCCNECTRGVLSGCVLTYKYSKISKDYNSAGAMNVQEVHSRTVLPYRYRKTSKDNSSICAMTVGEVTLEYYYRRTKCSEECVSKQPAVRLPDLFFCCFVCLFSVVFLFLLSYVQVF